MFSSNGDGALTFDDFLNMMSVLSDSVSVKGIFFLSNADLPFTRHFTKFKILKTILLVSCLKRTKMLKATCI